MKSRERPYLVLGLLFSVGGLAIGLGSTVAGMIRAFNALQSGTQSPQLAADSAKSFYLTVVLMPLVLLGAGLIAVALAFRYLRRRSQTGAIARDEQQR